VDILKGFAAFTGWLGGALAGLGITFYAIGDLINREHLIALGIYGLFDASYVELITSGVMFALAIVYFIGEVLLPLAVLFAVTALTAKLVLWLFEHFELTARVHRLPLPFLHWSHRPSLNAVLYFGLLLLFLKHYDHYFEAFQKPLQIKNLLYAASAGQKGGSLPVPASWNAHPSVDQIRLWLQQGYTERAHAHFRMLLEGDVFAAMLLAAAWHVTINWRWRLLWVSYFAISFAIYTVYLPMIYGVLVDPAEALARSSGKLFLLNESGQDFILWNAQEKRVLWIPTSQVKWAAVGQTENLFGP
jgi:hypothetical protein